MKIYIYASDDGLRRLAAEIDNDAAELNLIGRDQQGDEVLVTIWPGNESEYDEDGQRHRGGQR